MLDITGMTGIYINGLGDLLALNLIFLLKHFDLKLLCAKFPLQYNLQQ